MRRSTATANCKISIHALLAESDRKSFRGRRCSANFYPRSPCGERPDDHTTTNDGTTISIHALLAESDHIYTHPIGVLITISIHALLAESDRQNYECFKWIKNFYPRSPCGERPHIHSTSGDRRGISIHALLAESDGGSGVGSWPLVIFLSTLSLRRATGQNLVNSVRGIISIHALLAESDH